MSDWKLVVDGKRPADVADDGEVQIWLHDEVNTHVEPAAGVCWAHVRAYRVIDLAPPVLGAPGSKPSNPKDALGVRKAPLSCVPMNVVAELGVAMLEGAAKYGRHNYRGVGVRASVYFDAAMRHLIAWWEGEDVDPDSGMPHIVKALATLAVLRDAQARGMCEDDRPPSSASVYPALNAMAEDLLARHAGKTPHHFTRGDQP